MFALFQASHYRIQNEMSWFLEGQTALMLRRKAENLTMQPARKNEKYGLGIHSIAALCSNTHSKYRRE